MSFSRVFRLLLRPVVILLLSLPAMLLLLGLQTSALVAPSQSLSGSEVSRIEQLILESAPRAPSTPSVQQLQIDGTEVNLLLDYGLELMQLSPGWSVNVDLGQQELSSQLSINLYQGRLPLYLNIQGDFIAVDDAMELVSLQVGNLGIPDFLLQFALTRLRNNVRDRNPAFQDFGELLGNVEQVAVEPDRLRFALRWDPELIARFSDDAQQLFISEQDQERIIQHYASISEVATTIPPDRRAVSLNTFLVPLFAAAAINSMNGGDPVAENRTLLQTLAIYVNDEPVSQLLGEELGQSIQAARFVEVRLHRRQDLAQHLVSAAAISASAGEEFAQLLSTTKEAYDARYRSGFSFSDLTANSVGVTLASLSTRDPATALEIQKRMAALQNESDYMPAVGSNRDGISESDFNALYTDRNSSEYQQRLAEISELISTRPLFQGLP